MTKALVLVDLQNDFFPNGALGVHDGDKILPVISELLKKNWDVIVASKDWHPVDHGSFASTHGKQVGERVNLKGYDQILWPVHCVQNTTGADFAPGWDPAPIEKIFHKGTDKEIDSYSTFFDNGHLKSTGLEAYLRKKGIHEIYLAGLTTEYCIKYSALDAISLGFKACVVEDGCRPVDLKPGDGARALEEMRKAGVKIVKLKDIR